MDLNVKRRVGTVEVHLAVSELLNEESQQKHMQGEQGSVHAQPSKIFPDLVELDLKGSLLV